MCCYDTDSEGQEIYRGSSILRENQYFDSEADFCRVYSEDVMRQLEEIFTWNRVSYFISERNTALLSRLLGFRKHYWVFRINKNDLEYAMWMTDGMRGIEVIAEPPAPEWIPVEAKRRREEGRRSGDAEPYRNLRYS